MRGESVIPDDRYYQLLLVANLIWHVTAQRLESSVANIILVSISHHRLAGKALFSCYTETVRLEQVSQLLVL